MEHGADEDRHNTYRRHKFDNNAEHFFSFKGRRNLDFIGKSFWLDDPPDKDTSEERHDGHQNAVADVIKEIQELQTKNLNIPRNWEVR